jgi:hypothetical protein
MKQMISRVGFLLQLFLDAAGGGDVLFRNVDKLSYGLHGAISQKTRLFITIAVRILNPVTLLSVFKALR